MMHIIIETLLVFLASLSMVPPSQPFELATTIETSDGTVLVESHGYAKMNLIRAEVDHKGDITLTGAIAVEGGQANVVLWAKVEGKYYFSRLPGLQGFDGTDFEDFAIPFSSPESPITEIVLDAELPGGGMLRIKDLELDKD